MDGGVIYNDGKSRDRAGLRAGKQDQEEQLGGRRETERGLGLLCARSSAGSTVLQLNGPQPFWHQGLVLADNFSMGRDGGDGSGGNMSDGEPWGAMGSNREPWGAMGSDGE